MRVVCLPVSLRFFRCPRRRTRSRSGAWPTCTRCDPCAPSAKSELASSFVLALRTARACCVFALAGCVRACVRAACTFQRRLTLHRGRLRCDAMRVHLLTGINRFVSVLAWQAIRGAADGRGGAAAAGARAGGRDHHAHALRHRPGGARRLSLCIGPALLPPWPVWSPGVVVIVRHPCSIR